ncbi:hypothetical protein AB0M94_35940 [Streptomyces xanthochromogenes]|uniref:hypothetical protein n=1 Tax=Streptomyces xanthochromogenes TaxID=67384 RepID=UPI00343747F6
MALGYLLRNQVATVLVIAVYTTGIGAVLIVVAPSFGRFLSGGAQLSLLHDPELTMPLPPVSPKTTIATNCSAA